MAPFLPELEPAAGEWEGRRGAGACSPALAGSQALGCDQITRPGASSAVLELGSLVKYLK